MIINNNYSPLMLKRAQHPLRLAEDAHEDVSRELFSSNSGSILNYIVETSVIRNGYRSKREQSEIIDDE